MQRLRCVCVGLLLLLGVLLLSTVATARREMLMATTSDEGRGRAGGVDTLGNAPEVPAAAAAASDGEDMIGRRKDEVVVRSHRRFRTRKIPASSQSQVPYGGRIPFTADYHSVRRHPPTHN
ncbi:unnamed protein product [Urochloa decumbens]|uniref:Uncharacterized protein n=1 Tax=Urochloa decumbens TaxID=240449 RepID=A0ABC9A1U8_9POAL